MQGMAKGDLDERLDPSSDQLYRELYAQLRDAARRMMAQGDGNETLQPTALVHEAWLRLTSTDGKSRCHDRVHFMALAARAMRSALVDHARRRASLKRGGDRGRLSLTVATDRHRETGIDVLELHDALERLASEEPRHARIVELRFFGGLEFEEVGQLLGISRATTFRDWQLARMWLRNELS